MLRAPILHSFALMTLLVGACLYDWDAYDPRSWTGTTGTGGSTAGGGGAGGGAGGAAAGAGGVAGGAATGGEAGSGGAGYCGDGSLLASEQCDDGNVVPLDGCDSGCLVECEGGLFNDVTHHCYRVSTASSGWQVAHSACLALGPGYDLAAISSVAEWDWLISQSQVLSATGVAGLYIGGTDALVEGQFVWTNGEPWGYDGWHTGEPNDYQTGEDYVEMNRTSNQYGLNDTNGQQLQRYLCELTPAGSNP